MAINEAAAVQDLDLPDKLYRLIRLALKDLEITEQRAECSIDMHQYLVLDGRSTAGHCVMCLAGSVMYMEDPVARELLQPGAVHELSPSSYSTEVGKKLRFLSWLQFGRIMGAFNQVGRPVPEGFERRMYITPYSSNPVEYKATLSKWADKLEALDI